jgi:hypothetical protein
MVLLLNIGSKLGTGAEALVVTIGAVVRIYWCGYPLEHVVVGGRESGFTMCKCSCPTLRRLVDNRSIECHDR